MYFKFFYIIGYQAAYSQLNFAGKKKESLYEVGDPKVHLAKCLHQLCAAHPGKVSFYLPFGEQNLRLKCIHY